MTLTKKELTEIAEKLYDRAFFSSPYPNPSPEDKAWKQGMIEASRMVQRMAGDLRPTEGGSVKP